MQLTSSAVQETKRMQIRGEVDPRGWFNDARYGMFLHWGPYAEWGRGEQVLFREHLDPREYERRACAWNPRHFDAEAWAAAAVEGGFRYAVLTTRHHDGYCLWDTATTDYSSVEQAPGRDFVREYVEALRSAGLRVGLYYSLADWRVPSYWAGPERDADGFAAFREYVHRQVRELMSGYGPIDVLWFDGAWPHSAERWRSRELVEMIRKLQPNVMINNRLDAEAQVPTGAIEAAGASADLGDFSTPEHVVVADPHRPWESCQVTTQRLWGFAIGEWWRPAHQWLDLLCQSASRGGNLLLNVGIDADGRLPRPFLESNRAVGRWLSRHGEAIYGTTRGDVTEFVTRGYQTRRGNTLYLILRFDDGRPELRLSGFARPPTAAHYLGTGTPLSLRTEPDPDAFVIEGLPDRSREELYPVIELEFASAPEPAPWASDRLWQGNPTRMIPWAERRGTSGFDAISPPSS